MFAWSLGHNASRHCSCSVPLRRVFDTVCSSFWWLGRVLCDVRARSFAARRLMQTEDLELNEFVLSFPCMYHRVVAACIDDLAYQFSWLAILMAVCDHRLKKYIYPRELNSYCRHRRPRNAILNAEVRNSQFGNLYVNLYKVKYDRCWCIKVICTICLFVFFGILLIIGFCLSFR